MTALRMAASADRLLTLVFCFEIPNARRVVNADSFDT